MSHHRRVFLVTLSNRVFASCVAAIERFFLFLLCCRDTHTRTSPAIFPLSPNYCEVNSPGHTSCFGASIDKLFLSIKHFAQVLPHFSHSIVMCLVVLSSSHTPYSLADSNQTVKTKMVSRLRFATHVCNQIDCKESLTLAVIVLLLMLFQPACSKPITPSGTADFGHFDHHSDPYYNSTFSVSPSRASSTKSARMRQMSHSSFEPPEATLASSSSSASVAQFNDRRRDMFLEDYSNSIKHIEVVDTSSVSCRDSV